MSVTFAHKLDRLPHYEAGMHEDAARAAFGADEVVAGIGRGTPFSAAAFALEPGKTSTPIKIARGFAILHLVSESPARQPALAEVEAKVRPAAVRAKAGDLAVARLTQARGALASGKSLDDVAKELGVEAKDSGEFGRDGNIEGLGDAREMISAALAGKAGDVGTPILTEQGAVLYQVTSRKGFDAAAFATERADQQGDGSCVVHAFDFLSQRASASVSYRHAKLPAAPDHFVSAAGRTTAGWRLSALVGATAWHALSISRRPWAECLAPLFAPAGGEEGRGGEGGDMRTLIANPSRRPQDIHDRPA